MNTLTKLGVPIGLGIAAGALNFLALRQPEFEYVQADKQIFTGTPLSVTDADGQLKSLKVNSEIPGAVPWSERRVLSGRASPRVLEKGDVLLLRDIVAAAPRLDLQQGEVAINISLENVRYESQLLKVGHQVGFAVRGGASLPSSTANVRSDDPQYEILGPFRIVSLGTEIRDTSRDGGDSSSGSETVATLSIASNVNKKFLDGAASRLIEANRNRMIGAVVVYPVDEIKNGDKSAYQRKEPATEEGK